MRRLMVAAVIAIAGLSSIGAAQALPGSPGLPLAGAGALAENVALVCRPVWNGWRWVEQCYHTAPRHYAPRAYYGPPRFHGHRHHHRHHRHHHHRRHFH